MFSGYRWSSAYMITIFSMKEIAHWLKLKTVVFLFNGQLVFNFKCILHLEKDTKKQQSYFICELIALFLVPR